MNDYPFLYDQRITQMHPLVPPQQMRENIPVSEASYRTVMTGRKDIEAILDGTDERFLLIVGPCSIHVPAAALDYAARLLRLREQYRDIFCIVMRAYFEKPRSGLGWRGLIVEPGLDGRIDMLKGLETARKTLQAITELGLPAASELLDPIVPQYTADFISWASIGARSAESQIHRELASGLSMPVGFKNPTDGAMHTAVNAIVSARRPHAFLGIGQNGCAAVMHTGGNEHAHLVLRGSAHGPNYDRAAVETSCRLLTEQGIQPALLIDCSHGNSQKDPERQGAVLFDSLRLRLEGAPFLAVKGCMLESFIQAGSVPLERCTETAEYGKSVTDPCLSWDMTEALIAQAANLLKQVK
jgi:phospho-2-dehydro-3-deoxyheptonate aldolase